jgi:H+-transporting ATPase
MLMVIVMITGDFLGMSLTTDNVQPNAWQVGNLTIASAFMGISELVFCTALLAAGRFRLGFGMETLRTLAFLLIVFGNQAPCIRIEPVSASGRRAQAPGCCFLP